MIDFQTQPQQYRHWTLSIDDSIAWLGLDVAEDGALEPGYDLKLNSYDLGVDIELYDAIQRLRFEHPTVRSVVLHSANPKVFCAGANIKMLGLSSHGHKVNFCKFTNETRNAIEDASEYSGQRYLCAINGTAAGGGYELALATDHIILIDDGSASVSLPEVPLLAVLPGTGGLTRLVDKRKVRRDLADVFCTLEEGVRGQRALDWRLVDEIAPRSVFEQRVRERATRMATTSDRPDTALGVELTPLQRRFDTHRVHYQYVEITFDPGLRTATLMIRTPQQDPPTELEQIIEQGADFWPLHLARELDDALLHIRSNETSTGTLILKSEGDLGRTTNYDSLLITHAHHWFIREINLYWKRVLKRLDITSRTSLAFIEPDSCFSGFLAELVFAADRSYMLDGCFEDDERPEAQFTLSASNFGPYPMCTGLERLACRFLGEPESLDMAQTLIGKKLTASEALDAGLITFAPDDIDWSDEIRLLLESRASFSPDALSGLEANLRFAGPETLESKIFTRLSLWQNWIFQRPNAVGEHGALKLYGTGKRPKFDHKRT